MHTALKITKVNDCPPRGQKRLPDTSQVLKWRHFNLWKSLVIINATSYVHTHTHTQKIDIDIDIANIAIEMYVCVPDMFVNQSM